MKSISVWVGVACRLLAMAGRIGSTRPMPMKAMTDAKATAQTAVGCFRMLAGLSWDMRWVTAPIGDEGRMGMNGGGRVRR